MHGVAAPYMLILQHHFVGGSTRIAAPLFPARNQAPTILVPHVRVGTGTHLADLLAMTAVQLRQIGAVVASAEVDADEIMRGLDAIFRGYPVGLPP